MTVSRVHVLTMDAAWSCLTATSLVLTAKKDTPVCEDYVDVFNVVN